MGLSRNVTHLIFALAGRPRFGGNAALVPACVTAALRRDVETFSSLSPSCSVKKRRDLDTTLYGPAYSGERGGL